MPHSTPPAGAHGAGAAEAADLAADEAAASGALPPGFHTLSGLVAANAAARPDAPAVRVAGATPQALDWRGLNALVDRVAAALQRDGCLPQQAVAVCASSSAAYVALFVGALRAGLAVAPLAPSATPAQIVGMASDADARLFFVDAGVAAELDAAGACLPDGMRRLRLDDSPGADPGFGTWLAAEGARPQPLDVAPGWAFNLIYSSGTTGTPKGIVQSHAMRWSHIQRAAISGYSADTVTLLATPLYSNTTLVSVIPTLAYGGCLVLMPKFDALAYLQLAQAHRATHTMLVPVQYQRLMARPDFGDYDLSSFRAKFCTSAPFHAELKADVVARWPGTLTEYYGMTEGGGTFILQAHLHPDKLHTVGQPADGHDVRLIDEEGIEIPRLPGQASDSGEVVGHSAGMMTGYHKQPGKTAEAEWFDATGKRFIRTGDVARFDEDGFLVLQDRRKDMVISGGFNIYPSDLEGVLRRHPAVADAAVFGVASPEWGETPVAMVVRRPGDDTPAEALRAWVNAQLGKTQRLSALRFTTELPRSAIGKVLKRELRDSWTGAPG